MAKTKLDKKMKQVTKIMNEVTPKIIKYPKIKNVEQLNKIANDVLKETTGKLEGEYWIWPSGMKTHLRHIRHGVQTYQSLPKGFYAEVKRLNTPNLNLLAEKAKSLGLKDDRIG